jgi:hypothetical protein
MSYLNKFERKMFSQNGEDGIIAELTRLLDPQRRAWLPVEPQT